MEDNNNLNISQNQLSERKNIKNSAEQEQTQTMECSGVLDIMQDGYGFLRSASSNFLPSQNDVYVSQSQIKLFSLRDGDTILGLINTKKEQDRFNPLLRVLKVNHIDPFLAKNREHFDNLVPIFPTEKFKLSGKRATISTKLIDVLTPIGKGQRAMIVAQPKVGKTTLLKEISNVILENHPEVEMMVLLIDERPEEVTDMQKSVNAEIIASTFDKEATEHTRIANIVIEKAKRLVECGKDVVILMDSLTRLARAYNTTHPFSGKVLSGGLEAGAMHKPKKFFGAARNIENGGSLTIIATALTETGSKMDEVIFEEFKGTGNMELMLERKIANRRIFPAIDVNQSSTRREDLLLDVKTQKKVWNLRKEISEMGMFEAIEYAIENI